MKIFCKLSLIVLLLAANVHADDVPGADASENALRSVIVQPADRYELARRLTHISEIPVPPENPPARHVGEIDSFYIDNTDDATGRVKAELRAVGSTVYVWVQVGMPVTDKAAQRFADAFDRDVYLPVTHLWGIVPPPGVDGDPHIYALFTTGVDANTTAYFSSQNTYPPAIQPGSNQHEMLIFNLLNTTVEINDPMVYGVAAHELQHLLRFLLQPTTPGWLDEGFSTFTSDKVEFPVNADFLDGFTRNPDTGLIAWQKGDSVLARYGAGLLFLSYFDSHYGDAGIQALSHISGGGAPALDAWLKQQGEPGFDALFADFVLANRLLDAPGGYGYTGVWQDADLTPPVTQGIISRYPLELHNKLPQYATHYFVLKNINPDAPLTVDVTVPETTPLFPPDGETADGMFWYALPSDDSDAMLTRAFDLTGVTHATLNYRVRVELEDAWDYGYVSISSDNGATWQILSAPHTTDDNPFLRAYGTGYTGSLDWQDEAISLDAFAGKNVLIRFEVITDGATLEAGMAIDSVRIPEIDYVDTIGSGVNGWEARGWAQVSDAVPQRMIVQAVQHTGDAIQVTRWQSTGSSTWTLPLDSNVEKITLAVSPDAPFTFQSVAYALRVAQTK